MSQPTKRKREGSNIFNVLEEFDRWSWSSSNQVKLANIIISDVKGLRMCSECDKLTVDAVSCESYKDFREWCCPECAQYCKRCTEYYCKGAGESHSRCNIQVCDECRDEFPYGMDNCPCCNAQLNEDTGRFEGGETAMCGTPSSSSSSS